MNFICPKCGKVEPKNVRYSFPAQADCPKCGMVIEDDAKFKIMSEEEGKKYRPDFYKDKPI